MIWDVEWSEGGPGSVHPSALTGFIIIIFIIVIIQTGRSGRSATSNQTALMSLSPPHRTRAAGDAAQILVAIFAEAGAAAVMLGE